MINRLHVLVVDDDRRMTSTLADILALEGYETVQASSAGEAIEKVKQTPFDCVLTDIRMPGMDGVELFHRLRQHQPGLPVIFMTAYAADDLVRQGLENGAVGVLSKPLDIHHLMAFLAAVNREHVVAVVDDDPAFCTTLAEILELRGFRVARFTDPHTDIGVMLANAQIVLLDMKLNAINGYDVLQEIRRTHPEMPVLLITGYRKEMMPAIEKALDIHALTCLYKPLVIPDLIRTLADIRAARLKSLLEADH